MSQDNGIVRAISRDLKVESKLIGSFEMKKGTLYVSDPSYKYHGYVAMDDVLGSDPLFMRAENMKEGKYNVFAFYSPSCCGGNVADLLIVSDEVPKDAPSLFFFSFQGSIPVDSGILSICPDKFFKEQKKTAAKELGFQTECSDLSANVESVGIHESVPLVAVHTGDGTYSVSMGESKTEGTFAILVEFDTDYWSF